MAIVRITPTGERVVTPTVNRRHMPGNSFAAQASAAGVANIDKRILYVSERLAEARQNVLRERTRYQGGKLSTHHEDEARKLETELASLQETREFQMSRAEVMQHEQAAREADTSLAFAPLKITAKQT